MQIRELERKKVQHRQVWLALPNFMFQTQHSWVMVAQEMMMKDECKLISKEVIIFLKRMVQIPIKVNSLKIILSKVCTLYIKLGC